MIWQICHKFDVEGGKVNLFDRFPFLEMQMFHDEDVKLPQDILDNLEERHIKTLDFATNQKSPRFFTV